MWYCSSGTKCSWTNKKKEQPLYSTKTTPFFVYRRMKYMTHFYLYVYGPFYSIQHIP